MFTYINICIHIIYIHIHIHIYIYIYIFEQVNERRYTSCRYTQGMMATYIPSSTTGTSGVRQRSTMSEASETQQIKK